MPPPGAEAPGSGHWTARHSRPIVFVILTLVAVGIYLALTIPIAVFPETNFPRIVVGVDNGVFPIDQMLVTVTRPIEEAVNTVPGLDHSEDHCQPAHLRGISHHGLQSDLGHSAANAHLGDGDL